MAKRFWSSVVSAAFAWTTAVPSHAIPSKPVPTLSRIPSRTEVMTTRAKTPSIRSVRVRIERSLCAHSSTNPPLMVSQTRPSWAAAERRRTAGPGSAAAGASRATLLIPQGLHGREPRRLPRRVDGEDEAEDEGEAEGPDEAQRVHPERDLERLGDDFREDGAEDEADDAAEARQEERLGHELLEDLPARGA